MTAQTKLDINLAFSPDVRHVTEDTPHDAPPAEFKFFIHVGVGCSDDVPASLVTLEELFDEWFAYDVQDNFWRENQFAMERLLEAQLQKVRQRLIQSGQYPSQ